MTTNKINQNTLHSSHETIPTQLLGGNLGGRVWEVSGGAYKGCNVGGWVNDDGDTTPCTDCSTSRFQSPC